MFGNTTVKELAFSDRGLKVTVAGHPTEALAHAYRIFDSVFTTAWVITGISGSLAAFVSEGDMARRALPSDFILSAVAETRNGTSA